MPDDQTRVELRVAGVLYKLIYATIKRNNYKNTTENEFRWTP